VLAFPPCPSQPHFLFALVLKKFKMFPFFLIDFLSLIPFAPPCDFSTLFHPFFAGK